MSSRTESFSNDHQNGNVEKKVAHSTTVPVHDGEYDAEPWVDSRGAFKKLTDWWLVEVSTLGSFLNPPLTLQISFWPASLV